MNTKRFVIRKSLIGKNTVITMTTEMNCFIKYGNYTNSKVIPAFARHLEIK